MNAPVRKPLDLDRIRVLAHRSARAEIARDVGNMVLSESRQATERDWVRIYLTYWFIGFAFYAALERCGNPSVASEIIDTREVQDEISSRVRIMLDQVVGER